MKTYRANHSNARGPRRCLARSYVCVLIPFVVAASSLAAGPADSAWYDQQAFKQRFPAQYKGHVRTSRYLTMRDGCKIAVDVHLPKGLESGARIPTILHQTRYWRSIAHNPPFDKVLPSGRLVEVRDFFLNHGYAWVAADVRGSGASFGYRPCEYSADEVKDGAQIVDWIIDQPWSSGKVGATGVSYDGGTAELLAGNKHPAVKAIAPLFSMFDPYLEVVFPGGVHLSWFTSVWGNLGRQLDSNTLPEVVRRRFGKLLNLTGSHVRPVDADRDQSLLTAAVKSHAYNWNLHETTLRVVFRDDPLPYDWEMRFDSLSPYVRTKDLDACGVAVYSYSGWFDAAFAHSAIKRHMTLKGGGSKNRLTLGPWNHGGKRNCSPPAPRKSRFDMRVELLRFFEHHLRDADTGIRNDKPVYYYTMGDEKWNSTDTWPPAATQQNFYLAENGILSTEKPTATAAADRYTVDDTHGTGTKSRWNCLVMGGNVTHPDRKKQDAKLLCYTTPPLDRPVEVTGHPIVTLHITSPLRDGNVLVYLEDIDESGGVHYLSEGMLRAIHRKLSDKPPPYKTIVPYRTYARADAMPLVPGKPAELTFDILPISHVFKAGHRIRVAIAGADVDHFANPPGPPPTISVHRSAARASRVILPVVTRR